MKKSPLNYNHKYIKIDGYNYHYVDEGNQDGELLVFVHGWPELWITNKNQIEYFGKLGYRVVAIDLIGIGGSEGPKVTDIHNLEADGLNKYTFKSNCEALNCLVKEELKRDQAIFIGHDWGSVIVWRMAQYFPETVSALASTCIHYGPPSHKFIDLNSLIEHIPAIKYHREIAYENWESQCKQHKSIFFETFYQYNGLKNSNESVESEVFYNLNDVRGNYERIKSIKYHAPVFNEEEFQYILDQYSDKVIENSCNYYRTRFLNFKDERELKGRHYINQPALMIHATKDITNKFYVNRSPVTKTYCTNLTYKVIEGDHWIILNKQDEVNKTIHDWLITLKY